MVFAKNKELWRPNLLPRTDVSNERYKNIDNDYRGVWTSGDLTVRTYTPVYDYPIKTPSGKMVNPTKGRCWRIGKQGMEKLIQDNRVWFGEKGNNTPRLKRFLSEVQDGLTPLTIWLHSEVGHNQEARHEIKKINEDDIFTTPKPERLIERILTLATKENDLVLDSFLGSGTTAAVAQKMGRRYIGIEMGEHAKTHCVPRLKAVIDGEQGGISKSVNWKGGGGFRFFKLGAEIFDCDGQINKDISFENLAAHIWFSETKSPFRQQGKQQKQSTFLGVYDNTAYALLYNGILKDKSIYGGNVLTSKTYEVIKKDIGKNQYDKLIIYGESSKFGANRLKQLDIEFKQTPYDVKAR
jgi:adenine-specific DNA-methyltransferase